MTLIYKIVSADLWREALDAGELKGMPVDFKDGYMHFSSAAQVRQTAALHFAREENLILLTVRASKFADRLKWEPSRGGDLFPHLYAPLPTAAVDLAAPLPLGADGLHIFPESVP